jgi:ribonuclease BN (tRNA processing enzyme)
MQVTLWGTRGSVAAPGPETNRYGGNTSCVGIKGADGTLLILDAGTGLRRLTASIPRSVRRLDILLTHLHLDHIQGLGFFAPLRQSYNEVHIWGPPSTTLSLRERLSRYLSPPLFPVYIRDLTATLHMHEVAGNKFEIGEFEIMSALVSHWDPTVGYRIESGGKVVTYLPDHEPSLGNKGFVDGKEWTSGSALAEKADLLIHDAQYTTEEYEERIGWGHSTIADAFQFAALVETTHLVPFHHDPTHSDDLLDRLFEEQIRTMRPTYKVTPGAEGKVFKLG